MIRRFRCLSNAPNAFGASTNDCVPKRFSGHRSLFTNQSTHLLKSIVMPKSAFRKRLVSIGCNRVGTDNGRRASTGCHKGCNVNRSGGAPASVFRGGVVSSSGGRDLARFSDSRP